MSASARVLHVDDDESIREVVAMVLKTMGGFDVASVASGAAALDVAVDWHPDLVLLDVMMPGMDGPQTLAALRGDPRTQAIPVIFLTAKVLRRDLDKLTGLGAAGIIEKPFGAQQLVRALRRALRHVEDSTADPVTDSSLN
ncbi:MAG: response regulator [Oligoflexia bacterium]|nr:response regulator [Oligoflexia bacterium]